MLEKEVSYNSNFLKALVNDFILSKVADKFTKINFFTHLNDYSCRPYLKLPLKIVQQPCNERYASYIHIKGVELIITLLKQKDRMSQAVPIKLEIIIAISYPV